MSCINEQILYQLLKHFPNFVSGRLLAGHLKLSRVSIWAHLEQLRAEGFHFEAVRNKGYRLIEEPYTLHEALLKAYLLLYRAYRPIAFFQVLDSTSTEAERQLANHCETPLYIISKAMTQGRGRQGRQWFSADPGNLYLSIAYRPNLHPHDLQLLTLWIGVHVCDFLATTLGLTLKVKWPNDLIYEGKKCAGILAEARIDSEHMRDLIVGMGLNINSNLAQWPSELQQTATSLQAIANKTWNMNALTARLVTSLEAAYESFFKRNRDEEFHQLWRQYDYLKGKPVSITMQNRIYKGIADGIDPNGRLILKGAGGYSFRFDSGDVTLSKQQR